MSLSFLNFLQFLELERFKAYNNFMFLKDFRLTTFFENLNKFMRNLFCVKLVELQHCELKGGP